MNRILDQLARSGLLVDDDMVSAIFSGNAPPLEEIVLALVIGGLDCDALLRADATSTVNQRRLARSCLIISFLGAIACLREQEIAS
jgi:hypothetical protein